MVLVGSLAPICMALATSAALKVLNEEGMAGMVKVDGARRLSSLSSAMMTMAVANSMQFYSQSSAR
jgi:hypothetical protein